MQRTSLIRELVGFMAANKKWWLLPLFLIILAMAGLIFLSGTAVAPFVYTLF